MAKTRGVKAATAGIGKVKTTNVLVFALIGLLILGLAGFGIGNFTGNVRAIGSVGNEEISIDEYGRVLNAELQNARAQLGQDLSFSEASTAYGVEQRALERVIFFAAIDGESDKVGLSVGDNSIMERLRNSGQFAGLDGAFDPDMYAFAVERLGLTAAEYEELVREEAAREILQHAVSSAVQPPSQIAELLLKHALERRTFSWTELTTDMLTAEGPVWTESELRRFYDENSEQFTLPERREITYAWLTPEMLIKSTEVDEQAIRDLYDERVNIYLAPERRIVDRLVFPSEEAAIEAEQRIRNGAIDFEGLLVERGVLLSDIDLGDVERGELSPDAAEAVFASEELGIVGPVQSSLGPALFRVNAVLKSNVSFEDAREELAEEIADTRARRRISDEVSFHEDLLAGGATLEELVGETALQLGTVSFSEDSLLDGIVQHVEFRAAARAAEVEDFPELQDLPNGGVFALRLDSVREPELQPLDKVRNEAIELLEAHRVSGRLQDLGESIKTDLASGKGFGDLGLFPFVEEEMNRTSSVIAAPDLLVPAVFELGVGDVAVHRNGNRVAVVRLDEILPVDEDSSEFRDALDNVTARTAATVASDAFVLFASQIRRSAGLELDQSVINAIHSQFQ